MGPKNSTSSNTDLPGLGQAVEGEGGILLVSVGRLALTLGLRSSSGPPWHVADGGSSVGP